MTTDAMTYERRVAGHFDRHWSSWVGGPRITHENDDVAWRVALAAFLFFGAIAAAFTLEQGRWKAPTLFARLLAGAVTLSFFTYAMVNMGMVSGILPVVGIPLPFVSYGGTAMVTLGFGLGILMAIAKSRRLMQS